MEGNQVRIAFYEIAVNALTMAFFIIIDAVTNLIELRRIKRERK